MGQGEDKGNSWDSLGAGTLEHRIRKISVEVAPSTAVILGEEYDIRSYIQSQCRITIHLISEYEYHIIEI